MVKPNARNGVKSTNRRLVARDGVEAADKGGGGGSGVDKSSAGCYKLVVTGAASRAAVIAVICTAATEASRSCTSHCAEPRGYHYVCVKNTYVSHCIFVFILRLCFV